MGEEDIKQESVEQQPYEKLEEVSKYAVDLMKRMDSKTVHISFTDKNGRIYSIRVGDSCMPFRPYRPMFEEAERKI